MRSTRRMLVLVGILLGVALAGAQGLPKLPPDVTMPQGGGSPGKVIFSHQTHVGMQAKADCTACHPRLAPIVKAKSARPPQAVTHDRMQKGQFCGACHNGTAARGFDDCTMCHRQE